MEGPFSIAVVFLLDEAHRLVSRLHRTEELEEFILWRLHTTPRSVDDLSDGAEQRLEERDLFLWHQPSLNINNGSRCRFTCSFKASLPNEFVSSTKGLRFPSIMDSS